MQAASFIHTPHSTHAFSTPIRLTLHRIGSWYACQGEAWGGTEAPGHTRAVLALSFRRLITITTTIVLRGMDTASTRITVVDSPELCGEAVSPRYANARL